jgi:hypothetical protein
MTAHDGRLEVIGHHGEETQVTAHDGRAEAIGDWTQLDTNHLRNNAACCWWV